MPVFNEIKVPLDGDLSALLRELDPHMHSYRVLRESLDARKKSAIHFVYHVETFTSETPPPIRPPVPPRLDLDKPPMTTIIGAGPAGLFAAYRLVERGLPCRILERGKPILERMRDISRHWKRGELNEDSNVCFGEGGAGTFSDGKLLTRIRSEHIDFVMHAIVRFGAPEEILFLANPHVGSNRIRKVISSLAAYLQEKGCQIHYQTRASSFEFAPDGTTGRRRMTALRDQHGRRFESDHFILATGHSSHDTYRELIREKVPCSSKSFAMGFRIEHPQAFISRTQYGSSWEHPSLPVANYKLTCHDNSTGLGVYSFCMCPGGYVLPSSAQPGLMVVNGMSNYGHGSPYANSGLVITIDRQQWLGEDPLQALAFQSTIEAGAASLARDAGASIQVPVQRPLDFLRGRRGLAGRSSCPSGVVAVDMSRLYPAALSQAYAAALESFERKMPGFLREDALLHGVESRTSSPIRIDRTEEDLSSFGVSNLLPAGEGAGYAGGITSAAVDGIRCAESIICQALARA